MKEQHIMKRYIKPETTLVDIYSDNICRSDLLVSSIQIVEEEIVDAPEEVLNKKDTWDSEWEW